MFTMKEKFASWRDEPIVTSRLRTDVYKFIMQYFARAHDLQNTPTVFGLTNRDHSMRLADVIPVAFLREQLDHVKSLRITPAQASFVQGMTVQDDGRTKFMFPDPTYSDHLVNQTLSDYSLKVRDGQFDLQFVGSWFGIENAASPWEIYAMAIISEAWVDWYLRGLLKSNDITHSEITALFAQAHQRVVDQCLMFRTNPSATFAQFGLRRQISVDHSRHVQNIIDEMIPGQCIGVSDVQMSLDRGNSNPKGTVAHELGMVYANIGPDTDNWIRESQFDVMLKWADTFPRPLRILLPDGLGTKQFFEHAPARIAQDFAGTRVDSMETEYHNPLYLGFLQKHAVDPKTQIVIPSDGQDAHSCVTEQKFYGDSYKAMSAGIGGALTNNIKGLASPLFRTPNMVIKAWYANGRPCTKIGDSPNGGKLTGPSAEHNKRVMYAVSPEGWKAHKLAAA